MALLCMQDTGEGGGGELLCYADELGKMFCYHPNSSCLRWGAWSSLICTIEWLLCRLHVRVCGEGVVYSLKGGEVRRWRWEGGDGEENRLTPFQPFSLALNKQLSMQCSGRDQVLVSFSASQYHAKFTIPCKLKGVMTHYPSVWKNYWPCLSSTEACCFRRPWAPQWLPTISYLHEV